MRAEREVRRNSLGHHVGPLRQHARIDMAAVIAPRPTVERAVLDRGQVVGHQVAANLVTLVDHGPQHLGVGLEAHAIRVAQPACEESLGTALDVDFPDRSTAFFGRNAVLADVAVGADRYVKLGTVAIGDDVFGPVVVDAGRQLGHQRWRRGDLGLAFDVRHLHQRIGVGNEELVADQHHAERRGKVLQEHFLDFSHTIVVGVAQQRNAVGARGTGAGALHDHAHHFVPDLCEQPVAAILGFLRLGRRIALGHEHVAVGQHIDPARMVEPARQRCHREAAGRRRPGGVGPTDGGRDVDGRDQRLVGSG